MPKQLVLRWPPSLAALCVAVLVAASAFVALGAVEASPARAAAGLPKYDHVVIVVEENRDDGEITAAAAPYINQLRQGGASLREMFGVSHPSQGNYFAMFAGKVEGASDQCPVPGAQFSYANLASKLIAAGKTFGAYMQGYPNNPASCSSGNYVQRHAPWLNFNNIPTSTFHNDGLPTDFTTLPTLSYVIPDNVNNMHSASVTAGDTYLKNKLTAYADWAKTHNSLLIVTWDESQIFNSVNDIETVLYGDHIKPGEYGPADTGTGKDNHYTMLRTLEDMYDLPHTQPPVTSAKTITAPFDQATTAPVLSQPPDQTSTLNQADSYQLQASGGTGTLAYAATGLPPGLSVNASSGLISGTPNQAGTFNVTATVTDSASPPATDSKPFRWVVSTDPGPGPGDPPTQFTMSPNLPEESGLAMSKKHAKTVYSMEDSGNAATVYAYDTTNGQRKAALTVTGATNTDWEALAVGTDGNIYVGDIGNNFTNRPTITVYRAAEPATLANGSLAATPFTLQFADGQHDAESMFVDPADNTLYVASKANPGKVYRAPNPLVAGQTNQLTEVTGHAAIRATATDGAFSPDGRAYVIRSGKPLGADVAKVYNASTRQQIGPDLTLPSVSQGESVTYYNCKWLLVGSEQDAIVRTVELPAASVPDPNCSNPQPGQGPTLSQPPDQTSTLGQADSYQLQASNGTPPLRYAVTGLPAGLTVNAGAGLISGTPTTATTGDGALVTATVTDSANPAKTDSKTFRWKVTTDGGGDGPTVTNPGDQTSKFNKSVFLQVKATGGTGALTFTATGLPGGLSMASSGWITGKAWEVATKTVTVTVTDGAQKTGTATFKWTVTWF